MSMVCDEMDAIVRKFLGKSFCKRSTKALL